MLEYENRLGKVYHFRAKKTKLGKVTYVASTKSSPDALAHCLKHCFLGIVPVCNLL